MLLAAAYTLTRRLWLSIGFHMAWNYTQSAIFSGIVSGGVTDPGLIRSNIRGPDVLTGGSFGLEFLGHCLRALHRNRHCAADHGCQTWMPGAAALEAQSFVTWRSRANF